MNTVVLCGALGSTAAIWEAQLPALEGHEVIVVEHPGHGSAPVEPVTSIADLASRVLDRVPSPFTFVGLSLGGAVGIQLALEAPDRVERLVLAATSVRFGEPEQWRERAATVRTEGLEGIVDAVLGRWFTPAFDDVARYRTMFLSVEREGYASCCDALARWDARSEVAAVAAPTLVIGGENDPTAPPSELEAIARAVRGSRLEVVPRAAHLLNVERPHEFNRLLEEFLQ